MRIEPPPSVPSANGVMPAATLAPAPELEPPVVLLEVPGVAGDAGERAVARCLAAELGGGGLADDRTRRARLTRSDAGASSGATKSASVREPEVKRTPLTAVRSLIETGSPRQEAAASPAMMAASARRAAVQRQIGGDGHERIEHRLHRLGVAQRAFDDGDRAKPAWCGSAAAGPARSCRRTQPPSRHLPVATSHVRMRSRPGSLRLSRGWPRPAPASRCRP